MPAICGSASTAVRGRYRRALRDRPCLGRPVRLAVTARPFVRRRTECPRRVFRERWPDPTAPPARTTGEPADAHRHVGLAPGGEAGARPAAGLGRPAGADTILRRVKDAPDEPTPRPRHVGLDDGATRKGHTYGTIVIDLERGTVIDLLPGRDGEALKAWPAADPQVEVTTRDRWPAHIRAATTAAPQAKPVADRFHLPVHVREAVEEVLSRVAADVRAASAAASAPAVDAPAAPALGSPPATPEPAAKRPTATEHRRAGKRQAREERFRRVRELTADGRSVRRIARRLRMSRGAVPRYRRPETRPDWQPGRTRATAVDRFAAVTAEWAAAGNRNGADPYRVLKGDGFTGGCGAARRYLNRLIGGGGRPGKRDADAEPAERTPPSARRLSFRVARPKPGGHSAEVLSALRERNAAVRAAPGAAEELTAMIRKTAAATRADGWTEVAASGDRDSGNLAVSPRSDAAAIQAAPTEPWSNGRVEGRVGRSKGIKRQMYGRAGMKRLRARVRHKG